jgi:hypothetical protein
MGLGATSMPAASAQHSIVKATVSALAQALIWINVTAVDW